MSCNQKTWVATYKLCNHLNCKRIEIGKREWNHCAALRLVLNTEILIIVLYSIQNTTSAMLSILTKHYIQHGIFFGLQTKPLFTDLWFKRYCLRLPNLIAKLVTLCPENVCCGFLNIGLILHTLPVSFSCKRVPENGVNYLEKWDLLLDLAWNQWGMLGILIQ